MKPTLYNGFSPIDVDKFEWSGTGLEKSLKAFKGAKLVDEFTFSAISYQSATGTLEIQNKQSGESRQITNAGKDIVATVTNLFAMKEETKKP